jgi:pantoate--beta-alanine ligase
LQSFTTIDSVNKWLTSNKLTGKTVGFVPTMGALHEGHLSLITKAKAACDVVLTSIFVNPTQFNSLEDLEKYPRSLENDIRMLIMSNCDAVFVPEILMMYPNFPDDTGTITLDFGGLDSVMEGAFRPGHFAGVANVVYRLFDIVKPDLAFFGEKDFQQLAIIKKLVYQFELPTQIVGCETLREPNGLAMSSRNQRLSRLGKSDAALIYQTLMKAKALSTNHSPKEVQEICAASFSSSVLRLEYLEVVHPETLEKLENDWVPGSRCFIAAYCEDVRLIDNMELIP